MSSFTEIDGRVYAIGLWWQIRSGGSTGKKAMLKSAQDMAARFEGEEYSHAALKAEQYGLGHFVAVPAKTLSLAATLRPRQDAFLGIFCLDDAYEDDQVWWLYCTVRGFVLAEGDAVFDSKEKTIAAADELRSQLENVGLSETIIDFPEETFAYLRPLLGPEVPITPLFKKKRDKRLGVLIGAVVLLVILLCGGLYWFYSGYQETQKAQARATQMAEMEAKKRDIQAHPERYFKAEWRSAPSALSAGGQCALTLTAIPIAANGWRFEEAMCRPASGLTATWAHVKGASFVSLPRGASLTSPGQATEERALAALPPRPASSQPLLTRDQATAALYQLTQNLAAQLVLSWEAPEQYRIDEKTTVAAPWQRGQFELTQAPMAALLEPGLFEALGSYPGLMLLSLTRNNELSLKGYIHANTAQK